MANRITAILYSLIFVNVKSPVNVVDFIRSEKLHNSDDLSI